MVTSQEDDLAPAGADIKTLREAAKIYYRSVLKSKTANNPVLGPIAFTSKKERKALSHLGDHRKLQLMRALRDTIERW